MLYVLPLKNDFLVPHWFLESVICWHIINTDKKYLLKAALLCAINIFLVFINTCELLLKANEGVKKVSLLYIIYPVRTLFWYYNFASCIKMSVDVAGTLSVNVLGTFMETCVLCWEWWTEEGKAAAVWHLLNLHIEAATLKNLLPSFYLHRAEESLYRRSG